MIRYTLTRKRAPTRFSPTLQLPWRGSALFKHIMIQHAIYIRVLSTGDKHYYLAFFSLGVAMPIVHPFVKHNAVKFCTSRPKMAECGLLLLLLKSVSTTESAG